MTIRLFKIFVAVCETMNMTSAAERLFMSQSAVSQAIAELESQYEVRLFERLSRKLYLTQAGQKLLSYAHHIIRMTVEAEFEMKTLVENGLIRIGASVTIGAYVLPKLVWEYKKINPQTEIQVLEDNTEMIEKYILNDKLDIALVEGEVTSEDIIVRPFMEDELVLIAGTGHRFAKIPLIEPIELEREDFIIREQGSGTRKTFENIMAVNNLNWKASWVCNNVDTIKAVVAQGLGVSIISERTVENEIASGLLSMSYIRGINFKRQFKIIYHKNKYFTEQMERFVGFCNA